MTNKQTNKKRKCSNSYGENTVNDQMWQKYFLRFYTGHFSLTGVSQLSGLTEIDNGWE